MNPARDHVFATPELLEAILVQLTPLNSLLRAQLVSKTFHTIITSSPKLQHSLFLKPNTSADAQKWSINPLLRNNFLPWFTLAYTSPKYSSLKLMDWTRSKPDAFLRKEASWRNMLIIQPPQKNLSIVRFGHGMGGDWRDHATIPFPTPQNEQDYLTMGPLYDIVESFLRSEIVSSFNLSFKNSPSGPQITLQLSYVQQCCGREPESDELSSKAACFDADECLHTWEVQGEQPKGKRDPMGGKLQTDLTPEKGGVPEWEWKEWQRKMAPIGALVSDVR